MALRRSNCVVSVCMCCAEGGGSPRLPGAEHARAVPGDGRAAQPGGRAAGVRARVPGQRRAARAAGRAAAAHRPRCAHQRRQVSQVNGHGAP